MADFIFKHGDELFNDDGSTTCKVTLRLLSGRLPSGMFAYYTVSTDTNGYVRVHTTIQARAPGGRRHGFYLDETEAQHDILRWAKRIMREHERGVRVGRSWY